MNESVVRQAIVPPELAGERLDRVAAEIWGDYSRSRIQQWIAQGELTLDGASAQAKQRVKGGETLAVAAEIVPELDEQPEPIPVTVVYEDDHLLIIDKPAGLVVHPGAGNRSGTLLNALLHRDARLAAVPRAGLVHRLDKDTSGLLVVARDLSTQLALSSMIERREVKRVYRAVCQSALTGGGLVDAPIDRSPRDRTRMMVRQGGREARTHYRLVERFRAHSQIEVELETGRTHQIRVHMAHIRAPLVGDPVYGGRPRLPRQPSEALRVELQQFSRQALHARALAFDHPHSGEAIAVESPLPADLEALLAALRADQAEHAS
jgi:23S rRNA pseudouridine1911/1915/1917 synthase